MKLIPHPTRYLFFTGKGGVGKTSLSTATAIQLADQGRRVLLVSTDAASNLDEMLGVPLRDATGGYRAFRAGTLRALDLQTVEAHAVFDVDEICDIAIDEKKDYVTDSGPEVYSMMKEKGIDTVFVLGVHTNMCVLNRTFAIKQMVRWDVRTFLVRDLTDAMYDPKARPFVAHDKGTQLIIEYIEKNWCPSVESKALVGTK